MFRNLIIICIGLLCSLSLKAQKINNAPTFRNFSGNSYFRINFDNDFFAHSDDNYTQGINLEFVNPFLKKNPLNFLFYNGGGINHYGLALEHVSFTPNVISKKEIQYNYRPFASALYMKFFKTESLAANDSYIHSSLSIGIIGPLAYGEEGQSYIHELTDNWIPYGWKNQVSNDIIINYEIKHEKKLIDIENLFFLNTDLGLRLGTMNTDISAGIIGVFGLYDPNSRKNSRHRKFQIYLYGNPRMYAIGYDATLQGGLFSTSIYTIDSSDVTRLKGQVDYGLVAKNNKFYIEYTMSSIGKEFKSGVIESWGGIRIGFRI